MKPFVLYAIGAVLIAAGVGCVLESGRRTGVQEANRHSAFSEALKEEGLTDLVTD